jgi:CheY-like chemotaxis protein
LQETVDLLRCIPDATSVETDFEAELGSVDMLPSELHQVVLNLLINASDAVRSLGVAAGVTLRASSTWRADPGGGRASCRWLRVSVIDRGPGMDAAVRARIFEPFFTTKAAGVGTGLGLCSVKDMVEKAGGWLEVESEVARGSSFHVYLPLSAGESSHPAESSAVVNPAKACSVLICDDEGRLGELTVGLLEEFGFHSQAVLQGEEALAVLDGPSPPQALLLDVNLSSGISASTVLDCVAERHSQVPVILTSGLSFDDLPEHLRRHSQVVSYLAKPYKVSELVSAIATALGEEPSCRDAPIDDA